MAQRLRRRRRPQINEAIGRAILKTEAELAALEDRRIAA